MNKTTLPIALLILLISGLLTACESDGNPAPDCVVNGTHIAAGDKIPSDECGGCACTDEGQIQCIDAQCTPESTYEPAEDDGGWGISEYYCCCKSGCPPGSTACLTACLVFGGGVCKNNASPMKLACMGSSPTNGCTCAPDNESTVSPQ